MKRILATLGAAVLVSVAMPAAGEAKSCSPGWKHAVLPSGHKCLRAGQFCSTRYDSTYHRYAYHCHGGRLKAK